METVQWLGIGICVFGALTGGLGLLLAELLDLRSYAPDYLLHAGRVLLWLGLGMALLGMMSS
jgi:hypothetical protein